jgi:hypothetical protein
VWATLWCSKLSIQCIGRHLIESILTYSNRPTLFLPPSFIPTCLVNHRAKNVEVTSDHLASSSFAYPGIDTRRAPASTASALIIRFYLAVAADEAFESLGVEMPALPSRIHRPLGLVAAHPMEPCPGRRRLQG